MSKKAIVISESAWVELRRSYASGEFRKFVLSEKAAEVAERTGFQLSQDRINFLLEGHPVGKAAITARGEDVYLKSLALQIAAVSWLDGGEVADARAVPGGRRITGFGAAVIRFLQELGRVRRD